MSFTSGLVLYAVLWFVILFLVLPFGVRSQDEAGEVAPGTPSGAPENPMIGRKMLWATIGAAVGWAALVGAIEGGVITHADIARFAPFD